jgi:Fanconi anemia group M protein
MQTILKPDGKPIVIADFRENNSSVKDYLQDFGALVKLLSLKVGDFICSDRVCVERKTSEDFAASIIDGRLFQQAEELKENFSKPVIIVEGNCFRENMNENAIKSALASIVLDYEIPVITTRNELETARTIFWLAKREQMVSKRGIGIKGGKKPKKIEDLQEHIVAGLPGVSTVLSKRILEKFKTIKNFMNAEESELSKVKGIGKVLAKRLHKIINEKYGGNA